MCRSSFAAIASYYFKIGVAPIIVGHSATDGRYGKINRAEKRYSTSRPRSEKPRIVKLFPQEIHNECPRSEMCLCR
jgi:hypothetical protein